MNHVKAFVSRLPKAAKVLDAGCGAGRDSKILSDQGLEVVGLDLSKGLLTVAKRKFSKITFVEGNLLKLPFEDASFDGAWANTSLLHLETVGEVTKALQEINRVLKSKGVLHIVVKSQTGTEKTAVVSDKFSGHDRFFQYFTLSELQSLLQETGFGVVSSKEYGETETIPHGRPEVRLIWALAQKV